ncbi:uncharacterized protein LOC111632457 [Centruroides sculpturatus]|uniref:uncharacterized protein LOC111632457 n=1 Tax=Centruroides sculpturatus TaxID=218467 RepID=UPI000C6DE34E|nr:uncharacterized protein LOC111632457 [Centruroides sculpturatus]
MEKLHFLLLIGTFIVTKGNSQNVTSFSDNKSEFASDKTRVSLSCDSDVISVNLNFTKPFHGVVYAGPPKSSCRLRGTGDTFYILRVPLDDCETCVNHQCSSGTFVNTLHIRYHPTLELEGDEIKTIICRFRTGTIRLG